MTNRKGRASKLRGSNILACAKGGTAGIRANLEEIGYGGECWATKRFDQCAELIRDTVNPSDMRGVPYIGLEHIAEGQLELAGHGSTEQVTSIKSRFRKGDILFGKLRPYFRKVVIAPFDGVCSTDIWVVRARQGIDLRYLFYWMASPEFIEESTRASEGTRMPRAQWEFLGRIEKPVPPLKEQQAIACILGALDDKIELNRRMNRTLEEMARAIFKSWFVDFDPVRAKATVRRAHPGWTNEQVSRSACPNLKPEIAALFPDSFVDSELGEIPKGWRVRPIGDVVQILGGGTPSTKETAYWEGGIHPFCTPKDMASLTDPVLLQTERHLTGKGLAKVSSGQLPLGTVLLSSRAPIGYLAIAETPVSINQGIIAMVCDGELPNLYVLHWTKANMDRVLANANGSTFMEISKRNFRPIAAVVPPPEVLHNFMRVVGPMHRRVVSSLKQIQHLAALRDTLLPKLISGVLRVPDAERIVGRTL